MGALLSVGKVDTTVEGLVLKLGPTLKLGELLILVEGELLPLGVSLGDRLG